jgi:hypothetical protein
MSKNPNNRGFKQKQTTKPEEVKLPIEDFKTETEVETEPSVEVVSVEEETKVESPVDTTVKAKVVCNKLRVRSKKSTAAEVVSIIEKGTNVSIDNYDPKAEWSKVVAINDDKLGNPCFVMTKYIEVI